jgi:hypothetical protein
MEIIINLERAPLSWVADVSVLAVGGVGQQYVSGQKHSVHTQTL